MHANRGRKLLVPFAGVVALQGLIGEHTGRTDFHQVAAELVLKNAVFVTAEEDSIPQCENASDPGRPRNRGSSAHSDSTGCTGSSRDSPADQILIAESALVEFDNGDSRDRSSPSYPASGTRLPHRTPGSRAG